MTNGPTASPRTQPSRRTVVRGAAWTVPAIMVAGAAPAYAASQCEATSWFAQSRIVYTDPDYSNANFDAQATLESTPPGAMSIQHWVTVNREQILNWRIPVGFPSTGGGAEAGATITIPSDSSYTNPTTMGQPLGVDRFKAFGAIQPELYTQNLPTPVITQTSTSITITFPEAIAPGSAGVFSFSATAVGGATAVKSGTPYTQTATMDFTPITC